MSHRQKITNSRRWVVKIGSSLLASNGQGLDQALIQSLAAQLVQLSRNGKEVVLVSSGAVASGMKRLGWKRRPRAVYELQAAAAVGQMSLIQAYESCFQQHQMHTAQVLLTHDDLSDRQRYLNARSTLRTLLRLRVLPVVNENDTVATDEIRFGDNDTLAGLVANLIEADLLVILTDQAGFYERDPRQDPSSPLITEAQADEPRLATLASAGGVGELGSGGMLTKVQAARLAARSGAMTVIAAGRAESILERIAAGEETGTLLLPGKGPVAARKQWLAGHLKVRGKVTLDAGAVKVLKEAGRSLLPVGVKAVDGSFSRGEMVVCVDEQGVEIARGLVNYDAQEARRIMGQASERIESLLGYVDEPELIHRDNLILV